MNSEEHPGGEYDRYADEYAAYVTSREQGGLEADPFGILAPMLDLLGDIEGKRVLDAGCGEGYLARVLTARGAHVTGIDLSPRLIEHARTRDPSGRITYRVADLSRPLPADIEPFDVIGSYLALNDVERYRPFAATLSAALVPGGRLVLALCNPYSAVLRRHVSNYFDSGATSPYVGLGRLGIHTVIHHRTLEEYLDAFLGAGLRLTKLADLPYPAQGPDNLLPEGYLFPRFMLLAFDKL